MNEIDKMRVSCEKCNVMTAVHSRAGSKEPVSSAYARCRNPDCEKFDHVFVTHISFSHWVDPQVAAVQMSLDSMFDNLPADAQKHFLDAASEKMKAA